MRILVRALALPVLLEASNNVIHSLVRGNLNITIYPVDILSISITFGILFYLGWRVATLYTERVLIRAASFGLVLMGISTIFVSQVIMVVKPLLIPSKTLAHQYDLSSFTSTLIAFILFVPIAAAIPALAALVKNRWFKPG